MPKSKALLKVSVYREVADLNSYQITEIIEAFKRDYLGQGLVNKYRLTRQAFRQLRELSRL